MIIKLILADQVLDSARTANVGNATKGTSESADPELRSNVLTFSLDPGTDSGVHTSRMSEKLRGLRSSELAREAGVSTDTLRHYERLGVLAKAPRTQSGYRVYPAETLDRVKMIRNALQLGFTLAELAEILRTRDRGGTPCKRVLAMLEAKLDSLEQQIADLESLRKYMKQMVGDWRSRVGDIGPGTRAHLLHTFLATPAPGAKNVILQRRRNQR